MIILKAAGIVFGLLLVIGIFNKFADWIERRFPIFYRILSICVLIGIIVFVYFALKVGESV